LNNSNLNNNPNHNRGIDKECTQIRVECWDKDAIGKNFMGCFVLPLEQVMASGMVIERVALSFTSDALCCARLVL
jgi:hypothetical protein